MIFSGGGSASFGIDWSGSSWATATAPSKAVNSIKNKTFSNNFPRPGLALAGCGRTIVF
jgi:hypothetical protein